MRARTETRSFHYMDMMSRRCVLIPVVYRQMMGLEVSYASEGPQWPTNSRYNASRDAVPAMRTDVNNYVINDVYV